MAGCGDVLSLEDLQTAKKHQIFEAEVITGKAGGVAGGAAIDYATNQVTGQVQRTLPKVINDLGIERVGDFTVGCTVTARNQGVLEVGGSVYVWLGPLPKVVPASSTPASTGGIGPTAWLDVGDASLRSDLAFAGSDVLISQTPAYQVAYNILSKSELSAVMASGANVSIAFFDDSTGDGFATTGWTANPTSGGEAVGNSNHNLTSPNSYPVKIEAILRDMFGNNNIRTFNAGYAGKSIADGWALRNYDAAITNNPFYGTPTATFIGFGLNDVRPDGSQIADFRDQLEQLIDKVRGYGTLPILLTCDPIMRNFNFTNAIYNREVLLQLDEVRREVAAAKKVPLIEKGELVRGWANNNSDGYRWFIEQSTDVDSDGDYGSGDDVGLHFRDTGHLVKAQVIAKELYPAIVEFDGATQRITANDARAKCFGNFLLTLNGAAEANSVQGFNFKVDFYDANTSHRPSGVGAAMSTLWVWNESEECNLTYRGLVGEGWGTNSPNNVVVNPQPPKIAVKSLSDGVETTHVPASVGFRFSGFYKPSDVPFSVKKLKYGLNKIEYRCGDFGQYNQGSNSIFFYGFFELAGRAFDRASERAAFEVAANTNVLDCGGFNRAIGLTDTNRLVFLLDADIPIGCGVSLLSSSTFFGLGSGIPDGFGSVQAAVLYRHDATRVRLGVSKLGKVTGGMINSPLNVAVAPTITGNRVQLRIEVRREYAVNDYGSGNQIIELYNGFDKNPANLLQTTTFPTTTAVPFLFGGQVGGFYAQQAINTTGGTVMVRGLEAFIY